jgi:hypothetical protein
VGSRSESCVYRSNGVNIEVGSIGQRVNIEVGSESCVYRSTG